MNLLKLAGLTAIGLMVIALFMEERSAFDHDGHQRLFPKLVEHLARLDRVQMSGRDHSVELIRRDEVWRVVERYDYPVDFKRLSSLLDKLSQAVLTERKTARVEQHDVLAVAVGPGSAGHRIFFPELGLEPLIVGKTATLRSGTFVRLGADAQVWLADQNIEITADPALWLDTQILSVPEPEIVSMTAFDDQGEALFEINRNATSGDLSLGNLPEGRALRYSTVLGPNFTAIGELQLVDVAPHLPERWEGAASRVYRLRAGHTLTLKTVAVEKDFWMKVQLSEDGVLADSVDRMDAFMKITEAQRRAFDFKISQRTYGDLTAGLEQFLKPLEEPIS